LIKEKINIKNMMMDITKLDKGNNGIPIMGCENGKEETEN